MVCHRPHAYFQQRPALIQPTMSSILQTQAEHSETFEWSPETPLFFTPALFCDHFRPRGGNFDSSRAETNRRGHSFVLSDRNTFNGRVRWVRRRELEEGKAIRHLCEKENRVNCKGLLVGHGFITTNIFRFSLCCPVLSVYNVWVEKIASFLMTNLIASQ